EEDVARPDISGPVPVVLAEARDFGAGGLGFPPGGPGEQVQPVVHGRASEESPSLCRLRLGYLRPRLSPPESSMSSTVGCSGPAVRHSPPTAAAEERLNTETITRRRGHRPGRRSGGLPPLHIP